MAATDFEVYKVLVEEHRFLTGLVWKIFGIASTVLFAAPFLISSRTNLFSTISSENLYLGILGFLMTLLVFIILFNYRRRENILENHIVSMEEKLKIRVFSGVREQLNTQPYFSTRKLGFEFPRWPHENRWFMGGIFLLLLAIYAGISLVQFGVLKL